MTIIGESIVSCYADMTSFLVMLLLLILAERLHKRQNESMKILFHLSQCITLVCVFSFICHAAYKQTAPAWHTIVFICQTLRIYLCFWILINWIAYVVSKLFGPEIHRPKIFLLVFAPFMIYTVLLAVNLFTGIVFTYNADNQFEPGVLYTIMVVNGGHLPVL